MRRRWLIAYTVPVCMQLDILFSFDEQIDFLLGFFSFLRRSNPCEICIGSLHRCDAFTQNAKDLPRHHHHRRRRRRLRQPLFCRCRENTA